jgi:hypothetical protein
MESSSAKTKK